MVLLSNVLCIAALLSLWASQSASAFQNPHHLSTKLAAMRQGASLMRASNDNANSATTICPEVPLTPRPGLEMAIVALG